MTTIIDGLLQKHKLLSEHLAAQKELSLLNDSDDHFRKTLLLSAASYFETEIQDGIVAFVAEHATKAEPLLEFVKNKAIQRQYYTYFNWDAKNANAFFGLFGGPFKDFMSKEVQSKPDLADAIRKFLELGALRNQLVHQNFASFPLEKTVDEIYTLYKGALTFVLQFPSYLRKYCSDTQAAATAET